MKVPRPCVYSPIRDPYRRCSADLPASPRPKTRMLSSGMPLECWGRNSRTPPSLIRFPHLLSICNLYSVHPIAICCCRQPLGPCCAQGAAVGAQSPAERALHQDRQPATMPGLCQPGPARFNRNQTLRLSSPATASWLACRAGVWPPTVDVIIFPKGHLLLCSGSQTCGHTQGSRRAHRALSLPLRISPPARAEDRPIPLPPQVDGRWADATFLMLSWLRQRHAE